MRDVLRVPDVCNGGGEVSSTVAAGEFVVSLMTATAAAIDVVVVRRRRRLSMIPRNLCFIILLLQDLDDPKTPRSII
jgi:hypothetical protein